MSLLKISPSLLDSYRIVSHGLYNVTPQRLIDQIMGVYQPTEATSRGTAFHVMLEQGPEFFRRNDERGEYYSVYEESLDRNWEFSKEVVQHVYDYRHAYPGVIYEVPETLQLKVRGQEIVSNMKIDGFHGVDMFENKTKSRKPKYHDYYNSLQWRMYLMTFPTVSRVVYHVFVLNKNNTKCSYHCIPIERDDTVEAYVYEYMEGFLNWLDMHPALKQKLEYTERKRQWWVEKNDLVEAF